MDDTVKHYLLVEAKPTLELYRCPRCEDPACGLQRYGNRRQHVKDAPIRGQRVQINFTRQRYQGKKCRLTSQQPLSGVDGKRKATQRLVQYVLQESLKVDRSFVSVANEVGVSEKTVRDIVTDHVELLEKTRKIETPRWLGIDDVYIGRIQRCVFTDRVSHRIIEILPSNNQEAIGKGLLQLPNRHKISVVTMDMWAPYKGAVRQVLPDASIVLDTFHVRRMGNAALKNVLARMRTRMTYSERRRVMRDPYLLLRRPFELSNEQKLQRDKWLNQVPEVKLAYMFKEEFLNLWDLTDRREAERRYDEWEHRVRENLPDGFDKIRHTLGLWRESAFNYFDYKWATNAFAEAVNGQIKSLQRLGRGFEFAVIRAKMLFGGGFVIRTPLHTPNQKEDATTRSSPPRTKKLKSTAGKSRPQSNVARLEAARTARDRTRGLRRSPQECAEWKDRFCHLFNEENDR